VDILAAVVWLVLVVAYALQGPRGILADLRDPVRSPFPSLAVITPMLLGAALATAVFTAGRILVVIFLAITITLGGWLTGQWMVGQESAVAAHPGYYLPTVGGGLIGAIAAAHVHLRALAEASFGVGIISWLLVTALLLSRLSVRPKLPPALIPTLAIEFAPPAMAGVAYFAVTGKTDNFAAALAGYAVLMAVVQLRFITKYVRLRFSLSFWSFTFPYATGATDALLWIGATKPRGATTYAVVVIVLITALIAAIAVRTLLAAARRPR
jgi:tellurite resistance protein